MTRGASVVAAVWLGAVAAHAQSTCPVVAGAPPYPFAPGEILRYAIDVTPGARASNDIIGVKAAKATLWADRQRDGRLELHAEAQTNTFASKLKRLRVETTSFVDPRGLAPQFVTLFLTGVGEPWRARVAFADTVLTENPEYETVRGGAAMDLLGTAYRMRTLPLKKGDAVCAEVVLVHRRWLINATVGGTERISTPAGEFEAVKLSGTARDAAAPDLSGDFEVYFSADARKLPLMGVAKAPAASLRAVLLDATWPGAPQVKRETPVHDFP